MWNKIVEYVHECVELLVKLSETNIECCGINASHNGIECGIRCGIMWN